jgi:hypothetical protein
MKSAKNGTPGGLKRDNLEYGYWTENTGDLPLPDFFSCPSFASLKDKLFPSTERRQYMTLHSRIGGVSFPANKEGYLEDGAGQDFAYFCLPSR